MYMPARALRGVHKSSDDLQLVGWQARMLESNHGAAPKYLTSTGTQKSRLLYNFPNARKASGPAIIVEGVTDVWKIGRSAVALLGKSMSPEQLRWIGTWFALRAVIVWLDRDAEPEAKLIQSAIIQARKGSISRGGVYLARCPKGKKDPGECSASEIEAVLKKVNQLEKSRRLRVT
jgi:DNA primase